MIIANIKYDQDSRMVAKRRVSPTRVFQAPLALCKCPKYKAVAIILHELLYSRIADIELL